MQNCEISIEVLQICTKCKDGFLPDKFSSVCGTCSSVSNCKLCKTTNSSECDSCISGFVVDQNSGQCVVEPVINCRYAKGTSCSQCNRGYFLTPSLTCDCPVGCVECTIEGSTKQCSKCAPGYLPTPDQACSDACAGIHNCAQCDIFTQKCTKCSPNHALYQNNCFNCGALAVSASGDACLDISCQSIAGCQLCDGARCKMCINSLPTRFGLSCGTCNPENCLYCDEDEPNICGQCTKLQAGSNGNCSQMYVNNCLVGDKFTCVKCGEGSYLVDGECVCWDVDHCAQCNRNKQCIQCIAGWNLFGHECHPVDCRIPGCISCYVSGRCRICQDGLVSNDWGCEEYLLFLLVFGVFI